MDIYFETSIYAMQKRGGISRIYNEIIPLLCEDNCNGITLITTEKNIQSLPLHRNIHHINFAFFDNYLRPRRFWRKVYEDFAYRSISDSQNKIFHSTYYHLFPNWHGPKVIFVYDMIYERYPEFFNNREDKRFIHQKRDAIAHSDMLLCISETTANDLKIIYPMTENKIKIVPLAPSSLFQILGPDTIPEGLNINNPFILYVGNRDFYKNFGELVNTYNKWKQNNAISLYVIGPEWTEREQIMINQYDLNTKIRLISDIDDEKLCYLYNKAAAFVLPSIYEGFGIPLLEAMACGCPIVASHIPSTLEIAEDIPYYFSLGDSESFLSALDQAISSGRNSDRTRQGLIHVKKFSWDKTVENILEHYASLL